jgi:hypothetical protein
MPVITTLEKLKALNGGGADADLNFCIDTATGMVLDHCHIDTLPDALVNTVVLIAKDVYRGSGFGTGQGEITATKEGDQTVQYVTIAPGVDYLAKYTAQLDKYRKIGW